MNVRVPVQRVAVAGALVVAVGLALAGVMVIADERGRQSRPPASGASITAETLATATPTATATATRSAAASGHVPNAPAVIRQSVITPIATAPAESRRQGPVAGRLARLALSIDTDDWINGQPPGFPIRVVIPTSLWSVSTVHHNAIDISAPTYEVAITSHDPFPARPRIEEPGPPAPTLWLSVALFASGGPAFIADSGAAVLDETEVFMVRDIVSMTVQHREAEGESPEMVLVHRLVKLSDGRGLLVFGGTTAPNDDDAVMTLLAMLGSIRVE